MKNNFEHIYNNSITEIIKKFIESENDYFLTEKDLHFHFFHYCLSKNHFKYNNTLLIHTEYPTSFKAKYEENLLSRVRIRNDDESGRRPHIDSILLNYHFIKWLLDNVNDVKQRNDYIRVLADEYFKDYINDFRDIYKRFFDECKKKSVLSHSLEFKFFRSGYSGIKESINSILYDLGKLDLIGRIHQDKDINFIFSKRCTLLVFIGERELKKKRRNDGIIKRLENMKENKKTKTLLNKFKIGKPEYSDDEERCVIRYDLKNKDL